MKFPRPFFSFPLMRGCERATGKVKCGLVSIVSLSSARKTGRCCSGYKKK